MRIEIILMSQTMIIQAEKKENEKWRIKTG